MWPGTCSWNPLQWYWFYVVSIATCSTQVWQCLCIDHLALILCSVIYSFLLRTKSLSGSLVSHLGFSFWIPLSIINFGHSFAFPIYSAVWTVKPSCFLPIFLPSHPTHLRRCSPRRWQTGQCERRGRRSGRLPSPRRTGCWRSWRCQGRGCSCCVWWEYRGVWAPSVCPRTSTRTWGPPHPGAKTLRSGWRRGEGNASAAGTPSFGYQTRIRAGGGTVEMETDK